MTIVEKIHAEFDNAQEEILMEAIVVIKENEITESDASHIEQMKALGFINSDVVKEQEEKISTFVKNKEVAELILYYKNYYPFLKFLSEDKLEEICGKYGLIFSPVGNYMKDVPKKNLKEIATAQPLKEEDILHTQYRVTVEKGERDFQRFLSFLGKHEPVFTNKEVVSLHMKYRRMAPDNWMFGNLSGDHMVFHDVKEKMGFTFTIKSYETINREGLFIVAPPSHFDLKGLTKVGKKGWLSVVQTEPKDPIVFRYVRAGIQVLSKWGPEAEDPQLVQGILN